MKAAAGIVLLGDFSGIGAANEVPLFSAIRDQSEFLEREGGEHREDLRVGVNAVGVKLDGWLSDRHDHEELTARCEYAGELIGGFAVAIRIERISVATESDVLNDVHAGDRREFAVFERKFRQVGACAFEAESFETRWPVVKEAALDPSRDNRREVKRRAEIDMLLRAGFFQYARGPCRVEDVVAVVGGFARAVVELGVVAKDRAGGAALLRERTEAASFMEVTHGLRRAEEVVKKLTEEAHPNF